MYQVRATGTFFPYLSKDWKSKDPSIPKGQLIFLIMLQEVNVTDDHRLQIVKASRGIHTSELEHMVYLLLLGLGRKENTSMLNK